MNLGMPEMLFIFFIALLLFGPKKLPQIGREIGKFMAEFKRASNEFKYQLEAEIQQLEHEEKQQKSPEVAPAPTAETTTAATTAEESSQEETFTIRPPQQPSVPSTYGESPAQAVEGVEKSATEGAAMTAAVSSTPVETPAGEIASDKGTNA